MNVILLGAPGSGKGTQSIILNKKFGFLQLSTGEMIRQNIEDLHVLAFTELPETRRINIIATIENKLQEENKK